MTSPASSASPVCCICYEENSTGWFVVPVCQHRWCLLCEAKYKGNLCVLCRRRFRSKPSAGLETCKNFDDYTDFELEEFFGRLPNMKRGRRKYYRALRQYFRGKTRPP